MRAAQFHEFVEQLLDWATQGDAAYLPNMRTQLVAARTVAEVLADTVAESATVPAGGWPVVEIAGPREENLVNAAMMLASRRGRPLKIEAVSDPGNPEVQLMEAGALLPGPGARLEGPTFEQWLEMDAASSG